MSTAIKILVLLVVNLWVHVGAVYYPQSVHVGTLCLVLLSMGFLLSMEQQKEALRDELDRLRRRD